MFKQIVKFMLPAYVFKARLSVKNNYRLVLQYFYDAAVYMRFNGSKISMGAKQLEGKIIAHYHVLEKGMSHPKPKQCFSLPIVESLITLIEEYDSFNAERSSQVQVAVAVLRSYSRFRTNVDCLSDGLKAQIEALYLPSEVTSGALLLSRDDFFKHSQSAFSKMSKSRYTVRDFTSEDVDLELLKTAIEMSLKTPSVCNRQTCKVHVLTSSQDITSHLAFQTGNRGFGDKINKLLIITSDLNLFQGDKERNQAFVDGGMFAMSLLYALHSLKIAATPLNWSYDKKQDVGLHKLGIVPRHEKIIMFVGVGHPPEFFSVATSTRRELDEVFTITR
jgi:nitroreductase